MVIFLKELLVVSIEEYIFLKNSNKYYGVLFL